MRSLLLIALLCVGCVSTARPGDLVEARAAFARASAGPAPRVTPGLMQAAKDELERAERAPRAEQSQRAYLALRRAEIADASARAVVAAERRNQLDHQLAALEREAPPRARPVQVASVPRPRVELPAPPETAPAVTSQEPRRPTELGPPSSTEAIDRLASMGTLRDGARGLEVTVPGEKLFVSGASRLAPEALATLENVAAAVKVSAGEQPVVLEVHGGGGPSREADLMLSQQRAESVRAFLISRGVDAARVVARGVGSDRPALASDAAGPPRTSAPGEPAAPERLEVIFPSSER
jgi:outer membrane protein OmpA-like peptidoglycan-associated protein